MVPSGLTQWVTSVLLASRCSLKRLNDTFFSCKSRSSELCSVPVRTSAQTEGAFLPDYYRFQLCQLHVIEEMNVHSSFLREKGNVMSWSSVVFLSASS